MDCKSTTNEGVENTIKYSKSKTSHGYNVKVIQSRYRPGVAQRVPGS
jgi:hypothetical protein